MPFEIGANHINVIGANVPIRFYSESRVLQAEIYLQSDGMLNLGGISGSGSAGAASAERHGLGDLAIHTGTLLDAQAPQFVKHDGSRMLTGNWDAGDVQIRARTLYADAPTGTAPLTVDSTTVVANLNADLLDGYEGSAFPRKSEDAIVTGEWTHQDTLWARDILPESTDAYDLGSTSKLWRKGYLSELETVLFALNTVTISGNRQVWGHNAGTLGADLASGDTTCDFGQAMTAGDFVEMRGFLQVEYFQVGTLVSGTTYRIGASGSGSRNLDGSGANAWPAGTPYLVLGASGDGRVEIDASGPRISILVQGATYNANTEYVSIGNLRNRFGIGANDYWGLGVGDYSGGNYLKYDTNGGFVLQTGNGALTLGASGMTIAQGTSTTNKIRWMDGATEVAVMYGNTITYPQITLSTSPSSGADDASIVMYSATGSPTITLSVGSFTGTYGSVELSLTQTLISNDCVIGGGMYLGNSAATAAGPGILTLESTAPVLLFFENDATDYWWRSGVDGGTLFVDYDNNRNGVFSSYTRWLRMTNGLLLWYDSSNANMSIGVTINQASYDNQILAFKSADVAHGMTDYAETDTYGAFLKHEGDAGGLRVEGYKDSGGIAAGALMLLGRLGEAADTTKSISGYGVVHIAAQVQSGTGVANVGSNGNLVSIANGATTRFLFDADGDAHADVQWTTYDDYDDIELLTRLEETMLAVRDPLKREFAAFLNGHAAHLEGAGIIHVDREHPGHVMLNTTRLSMLLVGALRQLDARIQLMEHQQLGFGG